MTATGDSTPVKTCTKCGECKPATPDYFHAYKRSPDGRRSVCKVCRAAENVERNAEFTAKKRAHYAANKDRILAGCREYYQANIEAQRASGLERHYRNRELRLQQMREYRNANRDSILESQRRRNREDFAKRYGTDLQFTLKHRLRALIRVSLSNGREGRRMQEILGYGVDELRQHLERQFTRGMSWEKMLRGEIHIDHIRPVASFNITGVDDPAFKECWCLSNLRPAWANENLSKGARITHLI